MLLHPVKNPIHQKYIYVSVKDLAELTSEGETSTGTLSDGTWSGTALSTGASGSAVEQVQFWLNTLAQYDMTFTVTRLLRLAEKKLAGSDNYTICGSGSDSQAEIHIREAQ